MVSKNEMKEWYYDVFVNAEDDDERTEMLVSFAEDHGYSVTGVHGGAVKSFEDFVAFVGGL